MQILNCVGGQYLSGGWALLEWGVRTGGPIFEKAYGEPFFEYCKSHPHLEENFSKAMTDIDHSCERQAYPLQVAQQDLLTGAIDAPRLKLSSMQEPFMPAHLFHP